MSSHYGHDMMSFLRDLPNHLGSAYATALYVLTHGQRCPPTQAIASLGIFDLAAFSALSRHRDLPVFPVLPETSRRSCLAMYMNPLGRLLIRNGSKATEDQSHDDLGTTIGYVKVPRRVMSEINDNFARALQIEEQNLLKIRRFLDKLNASGRLAETVDDVIDHVQHVEAVGFYVADRFVARMERFTNLIDSAKCDAPGILSSLRVKAYADWSDDDILIVGALHALFISGRSVRFEEFNGACLTATALFNKLFELLRSYERVAGVCEAPVDGDLDQLARLIRQQSSKSEGSNWLRYRWILGLTFLKTEKILPSMESTERPFPHLSEFGEDFELLVGSHPPAGISEWQFFQKLALASLDRDLKDVPLTQWSEAAKRWIEYLMERIVSSAVLATESDYGMSSSLRDLSLLVASDDKKLMENVHALENTDFFTCFVSKGFRYRLDSDLASKIAHSVQKRMMFNRWHFIPGNFERGSISPKRHWYYPPLLPDIAFHSDVHHAGHARAQVKYSVRAPGPDMSRPPLVIMNRSYRGFYDVRVVRMDGQPFTTEELLRVRRRTLWLEPLYQVLAEHLTRGGVRVPIIGFQPGEYLDIESGAASPTFDLQIREQENDLVFKGTVA